jgi:hypothetical protein
MSFEHAPRSMPRSSIRELAMLNLAIDSKLRGCDVVEG